MPELVTDTVIPVAVAIIASIISLPVGILIEYRRGREEDRRRHTTNVGEEVLEPLLAIIGGYYLPICQGRMSAIELTNVRQAPATGAWGERDLEWVPTFVPLPVAVRRGWTHVYIAKDVDTKQLETGQPDPVLYQHTRDHHLKPPLGRYEQAVQDFGALQQTIVSHAGEVVWKLSAEASLPVGNSVADTPALLRYIGLFVVERQLTDSQETLYVIPFGSSPEHHFQLSSNQSKLYANGTKEQMEQLLALVRRCVEDTSPIRLVLGNRQNLIDEFQGIHQDLSVAAGKARLPGGCSYA